MDSVAAYVWMTYYCMSVAVLAIVIDQVLERKRSAAATFSAWAAIAVLPAIPMLLMIGCVLTRLNQILFMWFLLPVLGALGAMLLYRGDRKYNVQVSSYGSMMVMVWCGMVCLTISQTLIPDDMQDLMRDTFMLLSVVSSIILIAYVRSRSSVHLKEYVRLNSGHDPPFFGLTLAITICTLLCYVLWFFEFGEANLFFIVVTVTITVFLTLVLRLMFISVSEVTDRARSDAEMDMSRRLQQSVLPESGKLDWMCGFDVSAVMEPAKEIGGDFYDFFAVSERKVAFAVADVSDKGTPSALFMMRARSTIREKVLSIPDLGDAITSANSALLEDNPTSMFVTAFVSVLDLDTGRLEYVNAGHPSPFITIEGSVSRLERTPSPFLGMRPYDYSSDGISLNDGDTVTIFTDGVTEAEYDGVYFGIEPVPGIVASGVTPSGIVGGIRSAVDAFQKDGERADDMTILSFAFHRTFHADLRTDDESIDSAIGMVEDFCDGLPSKLSLRAQMVMEELLANIVDHGSSGDDGRISITLRRDSGLTMTVVDDGTRFNLLKHKRRDRSAPLDGREKGGEGISIIRLMSERISYRYEGGRNIVTITFEPREGESPDAGDQT